MGVPQLPLIFSDSINTISKAKEAVKIFKRFNITDDILRVRNAKKLRAGIGKIRNRRFKNRRGPLIIGDEKSASFARAVRNLPGVDFLNVSRLNIRHLAPGGHLGRFCIWTESAIKALNNQYGSAFEPGKLKSGYRMNAPLLKNADITQLINSNEVQSILKAKQAKPKRTRTAKKNPLKNAKLMQKLNPYYLVAKEAHKKTKPVSTVDKKKAKTLRVKARKQFNALKKNLDDTAEQNITEYEKLISVTRF